jgi:DNA-binding IclR family transcriptional regulator
MQQDEQTDDTSYSAPALEKGLDILEDLAERTAAISLRDLAKRLGRSKNEIFRMVHVLIARGYIRRDAETEQIELTNKLFDLGLRTPGSRALLSVALPEMESLALQVDQSPHIVVFYKGRTVILAHVPARSDFSFTIRAGYGRLASDAATGKIIMAFQPAHKREQMVNDCERQSGDKKFDKTELHRTLKELHALGYLLGKSTDFQGVTDICCPVINGEGEAVAAVIVPFVDRVDGKIDHKVVLAAVQQCCERIGRQL